MSRSPTTRRRGRPPGLTGRELIGVARGVFLEHGYAGTTMDDVAARARISKSSLYRAHASKELLYAAVVRDWAAAGRDAMSPHLETLRSGQDVRSDLVAFCEVLRAGVLDHEVLQMRRLVTTESTRQPDVADEYFTQSWERNIDALADVLRDLHDQGRLTVPHPRLAADQLTWLVLGASLNRRLLTDNDQRSSSEPTVDYAVDLFLAGYRPSTRSEAPPKAPA